MKIEKPGVGRPLLGPAKIFHFSTTKNYTNEKKKNKIYKDIANNLIFSLWKYTATRLKHLEDPKQWYFKYFKYVLQYTKTEQPKSLPN